MVKIYIKKDFEGDWITRQSGERLRNMIVEASKKNEIVELDFTGVVIASTSFFDEGFAKLVDEGWTFEDLKSKIKFENMNNRDWNVLIEICKNRKMK
ncbi:MAG: STAS-like domain-containing protein [Pseudomonadota bacterium]